MSTTLLAFGLPGNTEWIIILVLVIIFFGVGKLPDVAKQLGRGIKEFKNEMNNELGDDATATQIEDQSTPPTDVTHDVADEQIRSS